MSMKSLSDTIEKAKCALAAQDQLELGRLLAIQVDDHGASTADLAKIAKRIGCSPRTLHYAIAVYRLAKRLRLTPDEVEKIGWTKLAVVAASERGIATKGKISRSNIE